MGPELIAVVGPVGSGKSSLLMAILNELPSLSGSLSIRGRVSYVAQQPWVFAGSIRENILFNREIDKDRYQAVLTATTLDKDLKLFPQGDATLVGERGVSLSGGQRGRIGLARAAYSQADVVLLDDPLAAVDASVGQHIFKRCICGLLGDKLRLLVTHQIRCLRKVDRIVLLEEGHVKAFGSYKDLRDRGIDFETLLRRQDTSTEESAVRLNREMPNNPHERRVSVTDSCTSSLHSVMESLDDRNAEPLTATVEARTTGMIYWRHYVQYFCAGTKPIVVLIVFFLYASAMAVYIGSDFWLSFWTNQENLRQYQLKYLNDSNGTMPIEVDNKFNLSVFAGMAVAVLLLAIGKSVSFFLVLVASSRRLHDQMFQRLMRAKLHFFDTNSAGRILNRFSKDIGHVDDTLPVTFQDFTQCFFLVIGILVVAFVGSYWTILPSIPLLVLFVFLRRFYMPAGRDIKRLESLARSPMFAHVTNTLHGLATIRSSSNQECFVNRYRSTQDDHTKCHLMFLATSRWFALHLEMLCLLFITIVVCFSAFLLQDDKQAGNVGLLISSAIVLSGLFQWTVRQSTEVENQMVSVERVIEYTQLETEASETSSAIHQPPPDWPAKGQVEFKQVRLRYHESHPYVLHDVSFVARPGEKIGIVGRTGAGKSSLITSLFRLAEPEGVVLIDDIPTRQLGLHDLRQKISIIPQDPVLFTGSIRLNLDPFNQHTDADIWSALESVQLKSVISEMPRGIHSTVSEGGTNWSVGQRQLICLARALLRNNKILMVDEATANVDPNTDQQIQQTIRDRFNNCTVLTIAHRLDTIMDSDRVLVMDQGRVAQFDAPYILLRDDQDGPFAQLVRQMGSTEAAFLTDVARKTFNKRTKERQAAAEHTLVADRGQVLANGVNPFLYIDDEDTETTERTPMLLALSNDGNTTDKVA